MRNQKLQNSNTSLPAFAGRLFFVLLLCSAGFTRAARAGDLEPWSVSDDAPVVAEGEAARAAGSSRTTTSMSGPVLLAMRFYSRSISTADGARCAMYPTCAGYAVQAVRKHGPVLGGFLAADRLMHEGGVNEIWYRRIEHYGVLRWYDPVEQNDFWFTKHQPDSNGEGE